MSSALPFSFSFSALVERIAAPFSFSALVERIAAVAPLYGLCLIASFALALVWTRSLERYLRQRALFDLPNARSSHSVPTPRGGGLAVAGTVLIGALLLLALQWVQHLPAARLMQDAAVIAVFAALAYLGHLDDRQGLSARLRLSVQLVLILPLPFVLVSGWPESWGPMPLLWGIAAGLLWVWMVNLTNFMDGIDGISGVQTACVMVGVSGLHLLQRPASPTELLLVPIVLGAVLGFLVRNWHPAKIFLGDVGSIPLGFIAGYLLLDAAQSGQGLAALILPLYYLVDATVTLLRRAANGEKIWEAHRSHFYQRAVQAGRSHAQVSRAILLCDAVLVLCAWGTAALPGKLDAIAGSAAIAVVSVAILLYWLSRKPSAQPR